MTDHQRNIYMDRFSESFLAHQREQGIADPVPYMILAKDAVQLAELLKKGDTSDPPWPITVERWDRALRNYYASPVGHRTLADFCVRFSTFWRGPLDRYGKPPERASQVGGEKPQEVFAAWHQKFLAAANALTQRRKDVWDAIEVLYDEVSQGLSEHEAFRRLKELEQEAT
jgi:hypothetical protein